MKEGDIRRNSEDPDGQNAFDFFVGDWVGKNRRLTDYFSENARWVEFESHSTARMLWDGRGNLDETVFHRPQGDLIGSTIRIYDPSTRLWALFFAAPGNFEIGIPQIGAFKDGIGEFFANEVFGGKHVFVRFRWTRTDSDCPKWEQAFSMDAGRSWKPNYTVEFRQIKA